MHRQRIVWLLLGASLLAALLTSSCGSDARLADACRQIESARCRRGNACIPDFRGDETSCTQFYDVQCGRGAQDLVKEPSSAELKQCLDAIASSCSAVIDPARDPACGFVVANTPPPDTGAPETSADAAETSVADTAETGG